MKRYIIIALLLIFCSAASAREVFSLNDNWQFYFKLESSSDSARNISLPHTWNLDALAGQGSYRQTTANYSREIFIPAEWSSKRLFLKFYGVQSVADVFVNGHHVGEHRGGWTAFTFEITRLLDYANDRMIARIRGADVASLRGRGDTKANGTRIYVALYAKNGIGKAGGLVLCEIESGKCVARSSLCAYAGNLTKFLNKPLDRCDISYRAYLVYFFAYCLNIQF